jgi:hypothetical protein
MRGVLPQQFGNMKIEENDGGCDLVVEYTKAPRFSKDGQVLTLGIHFNNADEANHARNVLQHGEADLDAPLEKMPVRSLEKSFDINL